MDKQAFWFRGDPAGLGTEEILAALAKNKTVEEMEGPLNVRVTFRVASKDLNSFDLLANAARVVPILARRLWNMHQVHRTHLVKRVANQPEGEDPRPGIHAIVETIQ